MEPFLVGGLTALTAVLAVAYWQLLVHPESLLALWGEPKEGDWSEQPPVFRALKAAVAAVLFLSGFGTGLTLVFLLGT